MLVHYQLESPSESVTDLQLKYVDLVTFSHSLISMIEFRHSQKSHNYPEELQINRLQDKIISAFVYSDFILTLIVRNCPKKLHKLILQCILNQQVKIPPTQLINNTRLIKIPHEINNVVQ